MTEPLADAQARLLKCGTKFRNLIDNIDLGVAWIDLNSRVILSNAAMSRLCGNPSSPVDGHHCHELFPAESGVFLDCTREDALSANKSGPKELERDLGEDKKLQIRVYSVPTSGEDGAMDGYVLVAEDISQQKAAENVNHTLRKEVSERKKMEETLTAQQQEQMQQHEELSHLFHMIQHAKREWEVTLDCIKEIVILIDKQGKIRRCNRALSAVTGKNYQDLVGADIRTLFANLLPREDRFTHKAETCYEWGGRWFLVNSYPLDDPDDDGGAVISLYDYTKLKQLTSKLEGSNQMLEIKSSQLEEAYAELKATQVKILQQEKMATIGQLAAGVAHEINNPIGFITSNLQTLQKYIKKLGEFFHLQDAALGRTGDDSARQSLDKARKDLKIDYIIDDVGDLIDESLDGTERVRKIVQDLKTFSRVDEAEWKYVDLVECLESTINMAWNEIKYKATLVREFAQLPQVRCFPHQLNQVFMNLLLNAAQAIDKDGQITVKAWHQGEEVCVSISDTGCGIPEENLKQIFMPFFTTKEVGKGTGLGLSLSYEIMQKHQGEILVTSSLGKGTTFTVRIPIESQRAGA